MSYWSVYVQKVTNDDGCQLLILATEFDGNCNVHITVYSVGV